MYHPLSRARLRYMASSGKDTHGQAGRSAHRKAEQLKNRRETRVRRRHPHLGGALLAFQDTPQDEKNWERGAVGERRVAEILAKRCPSATLLNDRRIPPGRSNIDHIAISATGVWIIDTKRYKGEIRVEKQWFGDSKLMVGRRDQTKLVAGVHKQVRSAQEALASLDLDIPLHGCLCFIDGDWPFLFPPSSFDGIFLKTPKRLSKSINADGIITPKMKRIISSALARSFPQA